MNFPALSTFPADFPVMMWREGVNNFYLMEGYFCQGVLDALENSLADLMCFKI